MEGLKRERGEAVETVPWDKLEGIGEKMVRSAGAGFFG